MKFRGEYRVMHLVGTRGEHNETFRVERKVYTFWRGWHWRPCFEHCGYSRCKVEFKGEDGYDRACEWVAREKRLNYDHAVRRRNQWEETKECDE